MAKTQLDSELAELHGHHCPDKLTEAETLRRVLHRTGWSQRKLAAEIEWNQPQVSRRLALLTKPPDEADEPLMPSQVVRRFQVDPKTITRWSRAGKLDPITTPGGHRRFRASDIHRCLQEDAQEEDPK